MAATTMHNAGLPAMLTPRQVQTDLGIDREQLFQLVTTRTFPLVKLGRTYRIPCRALIYWLAQEAGVMREMDNPAQGQELAGTTRGEQ